MGVIHKNTILHSLYAAFGFVVLTLTGIFNTFDGRDVIRGEFSLSTLTFALMVASTAYIMGARVREKGIVASVINAVIGAGIVGLLLAALVLFEASNDLRFMFLNIGRSATGNLSNSTLTMGKPIDVSTGNYQGLLEMLAFCVGFGGLVGAFSHLARRWQEVIVVALALTITISLSQTQLNSVITLPDAIVLVLALVLGYVASIKLSAQPIVKVGIGVGIGFAVALVIFLLGQNGELARGGFLYGSGTAPVILTMVTDGREIGFFVVLMIVGVLGAVLPYSPAQIHDAFWYFVAGVIALGILNSERRPSNVWVGVGGIFAVLALALTLIPLLGKRAQATFESAPILLQRNTQRFAIVIAMLIFFIMPQFMGLYISNVFNQIALYAIMGIGLNVMVGYTGLLDLGYVSSFAIGAYTLGVLTTPSLITCGGSLPASAADVSAQCTGIMTFWEAWPISVLFSGITGMLLGIPVLRLRGDYLAIVTLGFGEIISRIIGSNDFKDLLGGAQGIPGIPSPVINLSGLNPAWNVTLSGSINMYYLFLVSAVLTMFVVRQLVNSRTGRAWRAIKADEDVAQAMGINLMNNKLLAFGVSSAFAGLGGAVFGASVQGIFPRSFTLMVSINVLCLIIIGGMGSIPGVILGSFILIGLPELLRELDAYRMLTFGVLLVVVMLVKSEGLLPPKPPELAQKGREALTQEVAS
jgi:ABC-type branched-subunit amino acid transport system permease subunit